MDSPLFTVLRISRFPYTFPKTLTAEAGLISSPLDVGVLPKKMQKKRLNYSIDV